MIATIYALTDPATGTVRYIGKTSRTLAYRLKRHVGAAKYGEKGHRNNWIRSLSAAPVILPMCVTEERYASAAERFAIALYRAAGEDLVNVTDGGEGTQGPKTPEHLAALRGRPCPQHVKEATSRANKGNKAFLGRTHSAESKAKSGESLRAAWILRKSKWGSSGRAGRKRLNG